MWFSHTTEGAGGPRPTGRYIDYHQIDSCGRWYGNGSEWYGKGLVDSGPTDVLFDYGGKAPRPLKVASKSLKTASKSLEIASTSLKLSSKWFKFAQITGLGCPQDVSRVQDRPICVLRMFLGVG